VKAFVTIAALLLAASTVGAQPAAAPPLSRADVQAAVGWQNLRGEPTLTSNNWMNAIATFDAAAGWYWTEHLRTQVDAGFGSTGRQYRAEQVLDERTPAYALTDTQVTPGTFAVSQQYQFFHNAVFHPHVGAGVLIRREHIVERTDAVTVFDPVTRQSTVVQPAQLDERDRSQVRPFTDLGFKAYYTERAFFVTDARLTLGRRIDGVLFRFGFGVDF
jgi:hypothetical protein